MDSDSKHHEYYNTEERVQAYIEKDKKWAVFTSNILKDLLVDLPKSGSVLDVGCGYGRDVNTFLELGYNAFGIDDSRAMVEMAKKNYGDHFQQLSLQDLERLERKYDIVHCRNVLVHVPQKELMMAVTRLYDATLSQGTIILISKEGSGISITHTTGAARETILHNKEFIAELFLKLGASLIEPPYTLPSLSANGDRLFCMRIKKSR